MNFIFNDIFTEIAALLFLATLFGAIGLRLKQPLIVSFIALGIFVGPTGLQLVTVRDSLGSIAGNYRCNARFQQRSRCFSGRYFDCFFSV